MLHAEGLSYRTHGALLLDDVDFLADGGEFVVIIGPNGAGKSTLLRILAGELAPTAGCVTLAGRDLAAMKPVELAGRRAVVPQATHMPFSFTAAEVVALGQSVPGFAGARVDTLRAVEHAMRRVDILGIASRPYQALSGGERQRVHVARALCQLATSRAGDGGVLLLDEPTSSLDLAHQLLVLDEAQRLARAGTAVVAILHDWNLAARYADTLVLMAEGQVRLAGPPRDVLDDSLLSRVFSCRVVCNKVPEASPFVLPQRCAATRSLEEAR